MCHGESIFIKWFSSPQLMGLHGSHQVLLVHLTSSEFKYYEIRFHVNLLSWSYTMIGFVPPATPQTFSRIVVLPALALPMTRIRKWGHLNCSLRSAMSLMSAPMIYIINIRWPFEQVESYLQHTRSSMHISHDCCYRMMYYWHKE